MTVKRGYKAKRGAQVSEAEFRRLIEDRSLTLWDIGNRLGISAEAVRGRAITRGISLRTCSKQHIKAITDPEFAELFLANVGLEELAELYGCAPSCVTRSAKRLGLTRKATRWNRITVADYRIRKAMMESAAASNAAYREAMAWAA